MNGHPERRDEEGERLAREICEDPVKRAMFLQALTEAPQELRERVAQDLARAMPAITQVLARRAADEGDGEAMRLVLDVLQGKVGTPDARRLMIQALGGDM